jgi:predicted lipoprotein with Yx(FWY)xxD motif
MRLALTTFALVALTSVAAAAIPAGPIVVQHDRTFGNVLFTRGHKALYYWTVEQKAGGRIRCVATCAKRWPPLIVKSASAVPRTVKGAKGTFGVIRRPDGRLQVTHNKLAVYAYEHDPPNVVLCDNVDGWFVVRV